MKRKFIRNRRVRYGSVTVFLTVMVVVVTILCNVVVSAVTERYDLNPSMVGGTTFDVSADCYALLDGVLNEGTPEIRILFCDTERNVKAYESKNYYLYRTAQDIAARYDNIKLEYVDVFANPAPIRDYTYTINPLTGEKMETTVYADSVIVICDEYDYHRVYSASEFFAYDKSYSTAWGYAGEKKLASAVLLAARENKPAVGLLSNHGETFYDYEILTLLNDAGYTVVYLDLYQDPIPDNCKLLISYNPNTDLLTNNEQSDVSEIDILEEFLKEDGNAFLVFLGTSTPSLPNFEAYLKEWGVSANYYEKRVSTGENATVVPYRHMIKDPSAALTSDGYTIYGAPVASQRFVNADNQYVVFRNATSFSISAEGYVDSDKDGNYESTDGKRIVYPLYRSSASAEAWANGNPVAGGSSILMSLTEQDNGAGGASYVGVVSSIGFATYEYLQSAV